ncbi:type VI secretion system-associated FHA domain protein TagH [Sphingomonas sp. NBWT7]|uniref:type VI secretion system-associated FHA domain protein TagH n=1 Tax=Sphingomonas sp. NBWT7 TaxID=2596913 RepID=UPI0016281B00|nr:type VI secretion system-associated FHA domain protein TagH [Sphingomonas sp. NBWT7]QNE32488.1 type VI secretion system-associated FHA domain protein TagH [Sphingomonas sp. NBWT7]
MTLTLRIQGGPLADSGVPAELLLDRRGAFVGRAAGCDWVLPDPTRHLSSRHFEIHFDGQNYQLIDHSTNGTCLARTGKRLDGPHLLRDGDLITAGPFTIAAHLGPAQAAPGWGGWHDETLSAPANDGWAAPPAPAGDGWAAAPEPTSDTGWGAPPAASPNNGDWLPQTGPQLARPDAHRAAAGWDAPSRTPALPPAPGGWATHAAAMPPVRSAWDTAAPPPDPASAWSSAAPDRPPAPSPDDLWGRIAEGNVVDWARGGFGQPVEPVRDPLGLSPPAPPAAPAPRMPAASPGWSALPGHAATAPASTPPPMPPRSEPADDGFLAALGIDPARLDAAAATRAALLFRRLVAGMVVMLEARARAKAQLGAEATAFSPDGHNPLKFARTPDEALLMMLGQPQPGFMPPERAVEDAFEDLQSHQMATLRAMKGALRTTLERFSPSAIRTRAKASGMLERILPAARDAALWQAYEREFGGVAQGSDEAFLDMFAKEFREAYNQQARSRQ